ncbi:MAG: hypothetical protein HY748_01495 [Elusimicrobia bacterium]|nr:hypothetical protein [Elusimicrobiota bacterium]
MHRWKPPVPPVQTYFLGCFLLALPTLLAWPWTNFVAGGRLRLVAAFLLWGLGPAIGLGISMSALDAGPRRS